MNFKGSSKKASTPKPDNNQQSLFDSKQVPTSAPKATSTVDDILETAGKANNLTPKQISDLAKKLKSAKVKTADDAAEWLIKSQKALEEIGGLGAVNWMQAGMGAAAGAGALYPLGGLELSREDKMAQDLDPYN